MTPERTQEADWSSTGGIAFTRARDSCCNDLYIGRLGSTPRRLTYRGGRSASLSPHATKLAFVRGLGRRQREGDLYVVRANGRGLHRLVNEPPFDWSLGLGPQVMSVDWRPCRAD